MDGSQSWSFADIPPDEPQAGAASTSASTSTPTDHHAQEPEPSRTTRPEQTRPEKRRRGNKARKCWICLDEEQPQYVSTGLFGRGGKKTRVYQSEDPALGRLISPCRCKGSVKYVHEGCIKMWRNQNPSAYTCGRCRYAYQLARLSWAQRLRSPVLALALTVSILLATIFLLGFVADPILGLWLDPVGTIADTVASGSLSAAQERLEILDDDPDLDLGWAEHFLKGLFSLGLLGFAKAFLAMSPWQWWNLRTSGVIGGRAARRGGGLTGRERMEGISLTLVLIGVFTFLWVSRSVPVHHETRANPYRPSGRAPGRGRSARSTAPARGSSMPTATAATATVTATRMRTRTPSRTTRRTSSILTQRWYYQNT